MNRRIALMLIGSVAAAALLAFESASPALAQTQHLTRFAINPKEVEIQGYARFNESCDVLELPQIYLDVPPENGVVCSRPSKVTVRVIVEREGKNCLGRSIRGIHLIYIPRPRFTGVEVIRYTVKFDVVRLTVDADIRVARGKSDQVTAESGEVPRSSEPAQTQGPIPVCAPLPSPLDREAGNRTNTRIAFDDPRSYQNK
jgi:hypothetical protein